MKESVRIFRFIVIGTMNALIMALVVWLMMKEMSFDGDYMVANKIGRASCRERV